MVTIIYRDEVAEVVGATVVGDDLWLTPEELIRATGWEVKPEGVCAGDTCIPVPASREQEWQGKDGFNLSAFARHLGQSAVANGQRGVWVFGDSVGAGSTAASVQAPDFTLPDLDGQMHSLSDYRGRKVLLLTWASW